MPRKPSSRPPGRPRKSGQVPSTPPAPKRLNFTGGAPAADPRVPSTPTNAAQASDQPMSTAIAPSITIPWAGGDTGISVAGEPATGSGDLYVVVHGAVGHWVRGSEVRASLFGDATNVERLVSVGAIQKVTTSSEGKVRPTRKTSAPESAAKEGAEPAGSEDATATPPVVPESAAETGSEVDKEPEGDATDTAASTGAGTSTAPPAAAEPPATTEPPRTSIFPVA